MSERLAIGALAKRIGIRPSAVRFYERQGLVASERLPNGYRTYGREAVGVLRFIRRAKALGFSLEEAREILTLRRGESEPCDCVTEMIERNLGAIDARIAELRRLRRELRALTRTPTHEPPAEAICPILESDATYQSQPLRKRS